MPRMFRVLAFICLLIAIMFLWGDLLTVALIFFGQTVFFAALSYMGLSERMYLTIFNSYMVLFFVSFIYYIFFQHDLALPMNAGH
jgi:hypothetical protein